MSKSLLSIIDRTAEERGTSVSALCKEIGVNPASYYCWKTGKYKASHESTTKVLQKINGLNGHAVETSVLLEAPPHDLSLAVLSSNLSDSDKVAVLRLLVK